MQLKLRLDDIQRKLALADCGVGAEDPGQRCVRLMPARVCAVGSPELQRSADRGMPPPLLLSMRRSPSPAPEYDSLGNRINTREKRTRGKLLDERNGIIEKYQVRELSPARSLSLRPAAPARGCNADLACSLTCPIRVHLCRSSTHSTDRRRSSSHRRSSRCAHLQRNHFWFRLPLAVRAVWWQITELLPCFGRSVFRPFRRRKCSSPSKSTPR